MIYSEQDFCSRCEKKCSSKELVSIVCRASKSTNIIMICSKCTISFLKWLKHPSIQSHTCEKSDESFMGSLSDDTREDMR